VATRVELRGRLIQRPELRTTPAGTAFLRCEVDCGENAGELVLSVVMAGDRARALTGLMAGREVRATGALRAIRGRLEGRGIRHSIEVVAEEIVLDTDRQGG
jgi:primosomal replication protein N